MQQPTQIGAASPKASHATRRSWPYSSVARARAEGVAPHVDGGDVRRGGDNTRVTASRSLGLLPYRRMPMQPAVPFHQHREQ